MGDRRTRGVPERWLLPPAPAEEELAARWRALPFDRRRALARIGPAGIADLPTADRALVTGLVRRRIATSWRLYAAALVLGWLALMTVWGFGRSTFPDDADAWLRAGVVLGLATSSAAGLASRVRLQRARAMLDACDATDTTGGPSG